ncbi:hypothetical protein X406_04090, partial [Mycobacterium tuberculosis XTB13-200]
MCTVHSRFVLVMGILTWNRTRWRRDPYLAGV